jgi:hypothetical protein
MGHLLFGMGGTCSTFGKDEKYIQDFRKPDGKTPHERPRYSWEDNIKVYLRKIGYAVLD